MMSEAAAHDPQDEAVEVSMGEIESGGDAAGEATEAGGGVEAESAVDDRDAAGASADARGDGGDGSDGRSGRRRTALIVVGALAAMAAMAAGAVLIYWAFDDDGAGREAGAADGWFAYEPDRDGRYRDDDRHEPFGEGVSKDCRTVAQLPRHVLLACPRDGFGGGDFGFPDGKDGPRRFDRNGGWGWWPDGRTGRGPKGSFGHDSYGGDAWEWGPDGWSGWGPKGSFGYDSYGGDGWGSWADGWSGWGPKGSFGYDSYGGDGYRFDGAEPFGGEIGPREFFGGEWSPMPGPEWPEPSPWTCTFEWSDPSGGSGGAFGGDCLDLFNGFEGFEGFDGFDGFEGLEGFDGFGGFEGFDGFEGFEFPGESPFAGFDGGGEGLRGLIEWLLEYLGLEARPASVRPDGTSA